MSKKSQFSIEFAILMAFMFLVFVGFIAVISSTVLDVQENERLQIAEDIAALAKNEIELARASTDGYTRNFELPIKVKGNSYDIKILGNRELVVNYIDKEHVEFLQENICGDTLIPDNEIGKENGITCLNTNFDQGQCQNADDLNLCQEVEALLPGTICCCFLRYGLCGPYP
jgi:hypothetical protein